MNSACNLMRIWERNLKVLEMNHSARMELGLGNYKGNVVDLNKSIKKWSIKSKTRG